MYTREFALFFFTFILKVLVIGGNFDTNSDGSLSGCSIDLEIEMKADVGTVSAFIGSPTEDDGTKACMKIMLYFNQPLPIILPSRVKVCMINSQTSHPGEIDVGTTYKLSCVVKNRKDVGKSAGIFGSGLLKVLNYDNKKAHIQRGGERRRKLSSENIEVIVCTAECNNCGPVSEKSLFGIKQIYLYVLTAVFILSQVLFVLLVSYWIRSANI